jgi:hypothetical protein
MMMMDDEQLLQNADFLSIAMEQMDKESVEYGFVQDVYSNLMEAVDD